MDIKNRIMLASGSPRRRELLGQLGVEFEVDPVKDADESHDDIESALDVAPVLARRKAEAYIEWRKPSADAIVIGADTVVVIDNEVLGKPKDVEDARRMLKQLSGRTHLVVTGVAVAHGGMIDCRRQVTEVTFTRLTDQEIDYYIENYKPFDKAGAYGIQEWIGSVGISGIAGDFYNVMGLPLHLLYTMLSSLKL